MGGSEDGTCRERAQTLIPRVITLGIRSLRSKQNILASDPGRIGGSKSYEAMLSSSRVQVQVQVHRREHGT